MSDLEDLLKDEINLPSPPAIAVRILDAVKKDNSSFGEIAAIIASDPALSAKILRVANSSYYAPPHQIDSIKKALSLIGVNALKNIALSFVIAANLRRSADTGFYFDLFWKRSITAAVACDLLAGLLGTKNDDSFVTALLQDIGIIIMYFCREQDYLKVLDEKRISNEPIVLVEKKIFGFDHQEVGAEILKRWGLPENIYLPIRYHNMSESAPEKYRLKTEIISLADLASGIYHGADRSGKSAKLRASLAAKFNMAETAINNYIDSVAARSIEIMTYFDIEPGDMKPFSQILQEANQELGKLNLSYEQLVLELKHEKDRAENLARRLQEANTKLHELSIRDDLTGLYNHRYLQEILDRKLSKAIRYNRPFAMIMFDIDHFKDINDNYGHPVGDAVLKELSQSVQKNLRTSDIAARYGGEEFILILPEARLETAASMAERLRQTIAAKDFLHRGISIKMSISLGVANYVPKKSPDKKSALIEAVDKAMYQAKNNGRNRVSIIDTTLL